MFLRHGAKIYTIKKRNQQTREVRSIVLITGKKTFPPYKTLFETNEKQENSNINLKSTCFHFSLLLYAYYKLEGPVSEIAV